MASGHKESSERAEARRAKAEAMAERAAEARAESDAEAQAVEDKTARLKSLRLAKEASDETTKPKPPATKRKKR